MNPRLALAILALAGCSGYEAPAGADAPAPAPARSAPATPAPDAPAPTPAPTPAPATAPAPAAAPAPAPAPTPQTKPAAPPRPDLSEVTRSFGEILSDVVTARGLVRYDRLAGEPLKALDRVVADLAAVDLPADRDERLALWCNAYNANVLAMATRERAKPGFVGVHKVPGFFDRRPITVAGERMTLNDLENKKVRPLGDARIHAALVCAAMSCPPLRNEPFAPGRLDEQLDDQCRRWVNDPSKFRVVNGALGLSEILNWYGKDFQVPPYSNVTGFVLAYAESNSAITRYIINEPSLRTQWIPYDWTLNQAPGGK